MTIPRVYFFLHNYVCAFWFVTETDLGRGEIIHLKGLSHEIDLAFDDMHMIV
jgi:hypothetical protein